MYVNRVDAGKKLSHALKRFNSKDVVVLALPRGGVVVGAEVAKALQAPLGLVLVRKIGHPSYTEYAVGAVAEGGWSAYNSSEVESIDEEWLSRAEAAANNLIAQRREMYFAEDGIRPKIRGKKVIIVDDGMATGLTMEAAVRAVLAAEPKYVVIGVPVASNESIQRLERLTDDIIVLDNPSYFWGVVGGHYSEFDQVEDEQVKELLKDAKNYF